jgi:hypothetical protein
MTRKLMVWIPILSGIYFFLYSVRIMYDKPYSVFVGMGLLLLCFKLAEAMHNIADDLQLD